MSYGLSYYSTLIGNHIPNISNGRPTMFGDLAWPLKSLIASRGLSATAEFLVFNGKRNAKHVGLESGRGRLFWRHSCPPDTLLMIKAPRATQTLRAGCSKVEPKNFAPPRTLFPGAQDGQNLISWRLSLPSPTDPVWWRSMHAISSYRGNRHTNKQTQPQTHKQIGPITIHCAAKLSAQCKEKSAREDANTARWL